MKRSEAVELILSMLHHLDLGVDNSSTVISEFTLAKYSDASQLLEFIEDIGMLPPESNRSRETMMFDIEHVQYAHKWDEDKLDEEPEFEVQND